MSTIKKVLVCGGGGFIGGHMVKRLQREGCYVGVADLKFPDFDKTNSDIYFKGDLTDQTFCDEVFSVGWDEVYQFAADMGGAGYIFTGENDANVMHNSALINLNVVERCVKTGVKKVFYSSSACIYPGYNQLDPKNPKCQEFTAYPAEPDSEYGWEKLFSERLYLAFMRNHGLQVRIARYHNIFGPCFDDKTEVLTKDGWKWFKDITLNDQIASLSLDDKKLIYQKPVDKQAYPYSGKMYCVQGDSVNQCVTPDHKLYLASRTTKNGKAYQTPFSLKEAKNVNWNADRLYFTSHFNWDGSDIGDFFTLPACDKIDGRKLTEEKNVNMKDWFEFIGWFVSEGSMFQTPSNYTVVITQYEKTNSKNREAIKNLLKRMDLHFSEDEMKTQVILSNKQLFTALKNEGFATGAVNKKIPRWMLAANKELLTALYNSLMAGDGNKSGKRYTTVSSQLKDDFMELALKLGKSVNSSSKKTENANHNECYRINICDRKQFTTKRQNRSLVDYNGYVYDVTLPEHHVLLVRREGKVCWSGNCGTWNGGKEKAPAAMCRKVAMATNGSSIEVWGPGTQTRSFLYIDECIEATRRLMDSDFTGPVNIGSEEMISINDLAKMAARISGKLLTIENIEGPVGVMGRNSDNALLREKLGWEPTATLEDGMKKTYAWICEQIKLAESAQALINKIAETIETLK